MPYATFELGSVQIVLNTVNTMRCGMALVRGFPCQFAFRRNKCHCIASELHVYIIGLKTSTNIIMENVTSTK